MNELIINQIVIPIVAAGIGTILEVARRQFKKYLDSKQELIDLQKEQVKQAIGNDQYNKDKQVVQDAVKTAEQLGKEFNWEGTLKHTKVLELIEGKTGLTDEQIFNIIKATVLEVNKLKLGA